MAKTIATIKGTMLAPGISKNNRKYTNEAIGRMVGRMKERLNDPNALPVVMRTHHDAGDNSRLIVGRITSVQQESDGRATYEAKLYNTVAGRDIAALIDPDAPALRTTSVFGRWVGPTMETREGGKRVEVGEDLAIEALDFTASPGVEQSRIDSVAFESHSMVLAPIDEDALDGVNICESYEATVVLEEDAETVESDDEDLHLYERTFTAKQRKSMASKGQAMAGGRYPIANKSDLRNAIHAVGRGSGDHNAIRRHIIQRARALGLSSMIPSNWAPNGSMKESLAEVSVIVCVEDDDGEPLVKICATNVDPEDVKKAAKRAGKLARRIIDPDDDDDVDLNGDDDDDDDSYSISVAPGDQPSTNDESTGSTMSVLEVKVDGKRGLDDFISALLAVQQGIPSSGTSSESKKQESAVSETEKPAAAAAPAGLTEADMTKLAALIGASIKEAMNAAADKFSAAAKAKAKNKKNKASDTSDNGPAESTSKAGEVVVTETAKETAITEADRKKLVDELRESLVKEGAIPQRKGFRHVSESDTDVTPTGDELWDKRGDIWAQFFPWGQSAAQTAPADAAS